MSIVIIWIVLIIGVIIKSISLNFKSRSIAYSNFDLREGYSKFIKKNFILEIIPCIIIGVGIITNSLSSFSDFTNIKYLNPFVITFYISIIFIQLYYTIKVFYLDGDKFLYKHQGLVEIFPFFYINKKLNREQIKNIFLLKTVLLFVLITIVYTIPFF